MFANTAGQKVTRHAGLKRGIRCRFPKLRRSNVLPLVLTLARISFPPRIPLTKTTDFRRIHVEQSQTQILTQKP